MWVSLLGDAVRGALYASVVLLFGCFAFQLAGRAAVVSDPSSRTPTPSWRGPGRFLAV